MASMLDHLKAGRLPAEAEAVVPLQPDGPRAPFFCFPGADDDPGTFLLLAQNLRGQQPFYVVRDPRPPSERGVYTVEEAAGRLVEAIRKVQQNGPYVLGGHCMGGLLALEAARKLSTMGEPVAKVVLIETATPGYPKLLRNRTNYLRMITMVLSGKRSVTLAEVLQHLKVVVGLVHKKLAATWLRALPSAQPSSISTMHPNALAARNYAARPYVGDVVHFIAADEPHRTEVLDDPRLGWRDLVRGSFTVVETPGPADAIFKRPHVDKLAVLLASELDPR
jgi:thioesterase domain-containing protein